MYWLQSFFGGFFNCLSILLFRNIPSKKNYSFKRTGNALFFLFHFSLFHIVILLFLHHDTLSYYFLDNPNFISILLLLIASLIIEFIGTLAKAETNGVAIENLFFIPYLRVIPLTFIVIVSSVISNGILFIILKTIADMAFYIIYQLQFGKPVPKKGSA